MPTGVVCSDKVNTRIGYDARGVFNDFRIHTSARIREGIQDITCGRYHRGYIEHRCVVDESISFVVRRVKIIANRLFEKMCCTSYSVFSKSHVPLSSSMADSMYNGRKKMSEVA